MSKSSSRTSPLATQTGTATLDFGSGALSTATVVTGVTRIESASVVKAELRIEATADHSTDDLLIDPIDVTVKDIVAGVGFTIEGRMFNARASGTYTVNWILF
tara:strand:+ start:59 stop:367 length:309 start_codon:yes stop_codon:yes gene_type:complete